MSLNHSSRVIYRFAGLVGVVILGIVTALGSGGSGDSDEGYDFWPTFGPPSGSVIEASTVNISGTTRFPERPPNSDWASDGCPYLDCPDTTVITVSWANQTNGSAGNADQLITNSCHTFFGWCWCECVHKWSATVPLELGRNDIAITMTYPSVDSEKYYITYTRLLERPANVMAVVEDVRDRITLSWDNVTDATSYDIYWSTSKDITPENASRIVGVSSPYTFSGLAVDTPYYFLVKAVNGEHESNASDPIWAVAGWSREPIATTFSGTASNDTSIAVDSSGNPHIHYSFYTYDLVDGYQYHNYYAARVAGSWSNNLIADSATTDADIALSADNTVNVSYIDSTGLVHSTLSSAVWSPVTVDAISADYHYSNVALALDQNDDAHIAYLRQFSNFSDRELLYTDNTSGTWNLVIPGTSIGFNSPDGHSQTGRIVSFAVDNSGAAHFAYLDGAQLKYTTNQSGSWATDTIDTNNSQQVSMALDSNGKVHVVYSSYYGNLMYANNVMGTWSVAQIDNETQSYYPSVAIDSSDGLHIVYFNTANNEVRYRTNLSGMWKMIPLDTPGVGDRSTGIRTDITVDAQDYIHISYFQGNNLIYSSNR